MCVHARAVLLVNKCGSVRSSLQEPSSHQVLQSLLSMHALFNQDMASAELHQQELKLCQKEPASGGVCLCCVVAITLHSHCQPPTHGTLFSKV